MNINTALITLILIVIPIKDYAIPLNKFTVPSYKVHNFKFKNANDEIVNIHDYKNKLLILSFWASWCRPCLKEIPVLSKLIKKTSKNKNIEIVLISINVYDPGYIKNIFKSLKASNITPYVDYDKKAIKTFRIRALPTTYIISKDYVVAKIFGTINWISKENISFIKKLAN